MNYSEKLANIKYKNNKHPEFDRVERELKEWDNTEEAKKQDITYI